MQQNVAKATKGNEKTPKRQRKKQEARKPPRTIQGTRKIGIDGIKNMCTITSGNVAILDAHKDKILSWKHTQIMILQ